jgi:hypothetical protein
MQVHLEPEIRTNWKSKKQRIPTGKDRKIGI